MKITKSYLKKVIKEELQEVQEDGAAFYLVYDDSGMMHLPKIFETREDVDEFMENTDYDTYDFLVIPMNYDKILTLLNRK